MKESLKQKLNRLIEIRGGVVPTWEINKLCDELNFKRSNAERRLRPSESPDVQTIYNTARQIVGYRWIGTTDNVAAFLRDFPSKGQERQPVGTLF